MCAVASGIGIPARIGRERQKPTLNTGQQKSNGTWLGIANMKKRTRSRSAKVSASVRPEECCDLFLAELLGALPDQVSGSRTGGRRSDNRDVEFVPGDVER